MAAPLLSVVIPTLNEADELGHLLRDLSELAVPREVLVVDGGSTDGTAALASELGARVVPAAPGRGSQLATGAEEARAPLLCFLHADVRLPRETTAVLNELGVVQPPCAFSFRFAVAAPGIAFRIIELGVRLRCRLFHLPYGDQGLVVRRDDYRRAGGFPRVPLMEDVLIIRALRNVTRLHMLPERVRVSPRRWRRYGVVRATVRNWGLMLRFLGGVSPSELSADDRSGGRS